ncbi:MAG: type II toxin-antitoxin system VapC family toxin [Eggerthella lenta]
MAEPLKILVDANVWLDYGIATSENHESAVRFMVESAVNDVVLYVSSISLKDVFQLIVRRTKKELRNEGTEIDAAWSAAISESAWSFVRSMREAALVVPVGSSEVLHAETWRTAHGDLEDDLVLAAAKRVRADCVVTSDRELLSVLKEYACRSIKRARCSAKKLLDSLRNGELFVDGSPCIRIPPADTDVKRYRYSRMRGV